MPAPMHQPPETISELSFYPPGDVLDNLELERRIDSYNNTNPDRSQSFIPPVVPSNPYDAHGFSNPQDPPPSVVPLRTVHAHRSPPQLELPPPGFSNGHSQVSTNLNRPMPALRDSPFPRPVKILPRPSLPQPEPVLWSPPVSHPVTILPRPSLQHGPTLPHSSLPQPRPLFSGQPVPHLVTFLPPPYLPQHGPQGPPFPYPVPLLPHSSSQPAAPPQPMHPQGNTLGSTTANTTAPTLYVETPPTATRRRRVSSAGLNEPSEADKPNKRPARSKQQSPPSESGGSIISRGPNSRYNLRPRSAGNSTSSGARVSRKSGSLKKRHIVEEELSEESPDRTRRSEGDEPEDLELDGEKIPEEEEEDIYGEPRTARREQEGGVTAETNEGDAVIATDVEKVPLSLRSLTIVG